MESADKIINEIKESNAIVFCGAGISRNSGLPVVNQLIPYILSKLDVFDAEDLNSILDSDSNIKIPFEAFMQTFSEETDPQLLFDIFSQGIMYPVSRTVLQRS